MDPILVLPLLLASSFDDPTGHWHSPLTENLRWSIDQSARVIVDDDGDAATLAFFGLDLHTVWSTNSRDVATFTLQPYLTRVDGLEPTPPLFDGPDDWELVWRIFNGNFKLRDDGALNLRVGHFEVPFGLEHTINTNGTLRDYTHGANFGLKADWGATLNGDLPEFEYELGWSRGSGNEYDDEGDPGVFSGRIGTPRDEDLVLGLSVADGDFLSPAGVVERSRFGVDAQWYWRSYGLFGEVSGGDAPGGVETWRALAEVNWRDPHETVLGWAQVVVDRRDMVSDVEHASEARIGVRWVPSAGWSLSAQLAQPLDPALDTGSRAGRLAIQLRYRF